MYINSALALLSHVAPLFSYPKLTSVSNKNEVLCLTIHWALRTNESVFQPGARTALVRIPAACCRAGMPLIPFTLSISCRQLGKGSSYRLKSEISSNSRVERDLTEIILSIFFNCYSSPGLLNVSWDTFGTWPLESTQSQNQVTAVKRMIR